MMRSQTSPESLEAIRQRLGALLACAVFYALFTLPKFGSLTALVFLAAGLGYAVIVREKLIRAFASSALLLLLPLAAIVSTIWSAAPSETLRAGVQYAATVAIMIVFFRTLSLRILICALMLAGAAASLTALASHPRAIADGVPLIGGIGSKNIVAFNSSTTVLAALGVLFDRQQPKIMRLVAAPTVFLATVTLFAAHSAGALVSTIAGVFVLLVLVSFKRLPTALRGGAFVLIIAFTPIAWFVGPGLADTLFTDVLEATGKDTTLTGRTEIWNYGLSLVPDHPIFGRGYQAFWIQGTPDAEALWRMGNIAVRDGFNFHNQYLELLIEVGAVGVVIFVVIAVAGFAGIMHKALVGSSQAVNCLAVLLLSLLARSTVESVLAIPFSTFTALFMAACCVGITRLSELDPAAATRVTLPGPSQRLRATRFATRRAPSNRPT